MTATQYLEVHIYTADVDNRYNTTTYLSVNDGPQTTSSDKYIHRFTIPKAVIEKDHRWIESGTIVFTAGVRERLVDIPIRRVVGDYSG